MRFFKWWNSKEDEQKLNEPVKPEIQENDFVDNSEPEAELNSKSYSVEYGTGMPIDVIYGFINKDFEQKGYDDAMVNIESSYKESGKKLIINELRLLFQQVRLRYQGDIRDITIHITNLESQGLPIQAAQMKMRKETFEEHLEKIKSMEISLERGEEQVLSMVSTYERGFLKGLAAKSDIILKNNGTIQ